MTVYNGEFTQVRVSATVSTAPKVQVPLTGDDVDTATITIWNPVDNTRLVDEEALEWDDDDAVWKYPWDTTGLPAGYYTTRAMFIGPGTRRSWEYGRCRLIADKAPQEPTP